MIAVEEKEPNDDMCVADALTRLADDLREIAMTLSFVAAKICEMQCGDDQCDE